MRFVLQKKDETKPYWKRLTKDDKKYANIQMDWSNYVDEDEEEEEGQKGMQDWNPDAMQGNKPHSLEYK